MTTKPNNYEELTELICALLEGRLPEQDHARLEALLRADPPARRLYMQMIDQEIELSCLLVAADARNEKREHILPFIPSLPKEPVASGPRRWPRPWLVAAAVVLLLGTALALVVSRAHFGKQTVGAPAPAVAGPLVRDTWSEDFESGSLGGWTGTLISTNLPPGSRYGIAAVVREYPVGGPFHVIQLPEEWKQGLFALTTRSTLHVTYRIASRAHVNVFMHTVPSDPGVNGYEMYQLGAAPFSGSIGEWQTVSIPFSQFVRKVVVEPFATRQFAGGPPRPDELVTTLSFSSPDEIDLVIDRVWVTPTGSPRGAIAPIRNSSPL